MRDIARIHSLDVLLRLLAVVASHTASLMTVFRMGRHRIISLHGACTRNVFRRNPMIRGVLAVLVTSAAVLAGSVQAQTPAACKAGVDLVK